VAASACAQVLQRLRSVAASKGASISYLLDTKGPEIRTAMLRGGANLSLSKDQEVVLVAVGADYKTWEGGMNPDTGGRG
jgi:pyruvate kinase